MSEIKKKFTAYMLEASEDFEAGYAYNDADKKRVDFLRGRLKEFRDDLKNISTKYSPDERAEARESLEDAIADAKEKLDKIREKYKK